MEQPKDAELESHNDTPSPEDAEPVDEYGEPLHDEPHLHPRKRPVYKRPAFLIGAVVVLLVVAIVGLRYWLYARSHESTDDAFIDGHIVQISPKASGYISKVYVKDNQNVNAGDLIAEIDPRDYEAKVAQAKAALNAGIAQHKQAQTQVTLSERSRANQAAAGIRTASANVQQAQAQVAAALAEAARANADVQRYQTLYDKDEISRQRLDQAIATARTANAQVDASKERVAAAEAQVNEARSSTSAAAQNAQRAQTQISGAQAQVNEAVGKLAQANTAPQQVEVSQAQAASAGANLEQLQAALDQAELELSYTKIFAPESGRIARKAIEVGTLVQVGQPLMAIVPGEVWVTANFKESQIGNIRPGESVEINIDAYPDKVFKGHVDSIQPGTGARFSLIPPENATGSYVKVVQRVPVKIVFEPDQIDPQHVPAPGMSVVPQVKVK